MRDCRGTFGRVPAGNTQPMIRTAQQDESGRDRTMAHRIRPSNVNYLVAASQAQGPVPDP